MKLGPEKGILALKGGKKADSKESWTLCSNSHIHNKKSHPMVDEWCFIVYVFAEKNNVNELFYYKYYFCNTIFGNDISILK